MIMIIFSRHEEDGVQDPPVARKVLRLLRLRERHRHQVLHPQGAGHLLRQVLRGQVRNQVHQVQEGRHHLVLTLMGLFSSIEGILVVDICRINQGLAWNIPQVTNFLSKIAIRARGTFSVKSYKVNLFKFERPTEWEGLAQSWLQSANHLVNHVGTYRQFYGQLQLAWPIVG